MTSDFSKEQIPFRRQFPLIRILETAGVSLSPASVFIAMIAAVLLTISGATIDWIIGDHHWATRPHVFPRTTFGLEYSLEESIASPWLSVTEPVILALRSEREIGRQFRQFIHFGLCLTMWSLIGVVLCRRSAFLFLGDDESTVAAAVDYGMRRWAVALGTPLIPLASAIGIGMLVAFFGLIGRLPLWGSTWLFLISPIIAILGFTMAFFLIATLLAWPLMVAAVSIDDCNSFGGLSRAYSFLTGRPWQAAAYFLICALIGTIVLSLTGFVAETSIWCGISTAAYGSGVAEAEQRLLLPLTQIIRTFVSGIGISFFWSAATVIYLFLRKDVDGVPLDRIAPDDAARPARDPLPVVGIPATDSKLDDAEPNFTINTTNTTILPMEERTS